MLHAMFWISFPFLWTGIFSAVLVLADKGGRSE